MERVSNMQMMTGMFQGINRLGITRLYTYFHNLTALFQAKHSGKQLHKVTTY